MRKAIFSSLFALLVVALVFTPGAAQDNQPTDDDVNDIARQLYCPVCENVPLDVCPTEACAQWRATIREQLADGWSEEQIKQYFVEQYGARVLETPPAEGFNWLVYVLPPVAFVVGVLILFRAVRSWRQPQVEVEVQAPAPDDPYAARLEEELRRLESGE